jgi:hypothetical protein
MLPIIAALLRPVLAAMTVFIGTLGMALGQPSFYQVFGLPGLLVPVIAVTAGSVGFHYRLGPLVSWAYIAAGAGFYLAFSQGGTLFWLVPYFLAIISLPTILRFKGKALIGVLSFYTAMDEQVTLNILSISLLGLVGPVWSAITPFMYVERTIATVAGTAGIVALKSGLGGRLNLDAKLAREVR